MPSSHAYSGDQRVLHPLGHGQQEQTQVHGSHYNETSSSSLSSYFYNRQLELIRGESSSSGSVSKTGGRPGSATSAGAGSLTVVPAAGAAAVDGEMRGDVTKTKTKTKTTTALVDAFEVIAYEIGTMRNENSRFKVEKEILEEKGVYLAFFIYTFSSFGGDLFFFTVIFLEYSGSTDYRTETYPRGAR